MAVTDALAFSVIYLLTALWLDPVLFYYLPQFDILSNMPSYPGKPADSGALFFLSHFYGNPWTGAFLITSVLFAASRLTGMSLTRFGGRVPRELAYLPVIFMLYHFAREMRSLSESISLVAGLVLLWMYQSFGWSFGWSVGRVNVVFRTALFSVFAGLIFANMPAGYILFAVSCILFELALRINYAVAVIEIILAAGIPALVTICFFPSYTWGQGYLILRNMLPSERTFSFWLVQGSLLSVFFFSAGLSFLGGNNTDAFRLFRFGEEKKTPLCPNRKVFRGLAVGTIIAGLTVTALWIGTGSDFRRYAAMNRAMLEKNWDRILAIGHNAKPSSLSIIQVHLIDRALYKKEKLLVDLFKFPQNQKTLLLDINDNKILGWAYFWKHAFAGWTYCDLGLTNAAENSAREILTQGYRPGLTLLSTVYAVKNMPEAAGICCKALGKDPAFHSCANDRIAVLETGAGLSRMAEVKHLRAMSLKNDRLQSAESPLDDLVRENPLNRMAFEYRVAERLLAGELDSICGDAALFRAYQYPRLPRLYEEALLLLESITGKAPELCGYSISKETFESFHGFFSVLVDKHGGRIKDAYAELELSYRDSYFFYYTYFSPRKTAGT